MGVDLEAAEKLAKEPGVNPLARDAICDLVQEVRRLRAKVEASDSYLDGIEDERDEARRQLADLNASYAAADRYWSEKLTVAREALEWYGDQSRYVNPDYAPERRLVRDDCGNRAREALAKIGGSDDP